MMSVLVRITQNEWKSILRGRWVLIYGLIFLLFTDLLLRFGGINSEVLLSVSNIMLLFVPLVSMIYGILFLYQSKEYIQLLLAQPVKRATLFWGLYMGIATPLMGAYMIGILLPLAWHGLLAGEGFMASITVLLLGAVLTLIFVALGFLLGLIFYNDRIKGFGFTIVIWLFMAVLYDGLILILIFTFGDFPLEKFVIIASMLNPIDLARITVMLEFDISALMGYTGAAFSQFFGSKAGILTTTSLLLTWIVLPLIAGMKVFNNRDF